MKKRTKASHSLFFPSSTERYRRAILASVAVIGVVPVLTRSPYVLGLLALIMIYGMLAISIDLLSGYMGLASLGHASFFGSAAYCAGYLSSRLQMNSFLAMLLTLLFSVGLAMLFGALTTKVWDTTFMMVNMALCQIIYGMALKLQSITGGDNGMTGIQRPTFFGYTLSGTVPFYYFLFAVFGLVLFLVYRLVNSPFGLSIQGIKQSPKRMSALGFNILQHKYITYVISGTVAGVAGMMYVYYNRFVSPPDASTVMASKAFLMSLMGGGGTLVGPIVGAVTVVLLENFVSAFTARWTMVLGVLYVVTVIFSPKGIIGMIYSRLDRRRARRSDAGETPEKRTAGSPH